MKHAANVMVFMMQRKHIERTSGIYTSTHTIVKLIMIRRKLFGTRHCVLNQVQDAMTSIQYFAINL